MGLNWMSVSDVSFNSLLLLEEVQINWLAQGNNIPMDEMALALKANPTVAWYFKNKCPQAGPWVDSLMQRDNTEKTENAQRVRQAEETVLDSIIDWIVYVVDPSAYDEQPFVKWDCEELRSLTSFKSKTVIDVGAGTGRLALIAAEEAHVVYCVEPIARMRSYLKEKADDLGFNNVYVMDGLLEDIPFENDFADVVMGGHVFGKIPRKELDELERVTKESGKIILCPGNGDSNNDVHRLLINNGFSWSRFEQPQDGTKRKYWKTSS